MASPEPENKDYRSRAEELHRKRTTADNHPELNAEELLEELHIHQIELELQNEDLKAARQEAEKTRDWYFFLFDLAPTAYVVTDRDGFITNANLKAAELFEKPRSQIPGRKLSSFFGGYEGTDAVRVEALLDKIYDGEQADAGRLQLKTTNSEERYVELEISTPESEDIDRAHYLFVSLIDVTEQKLREDREHAVSHYRSLLRELTHRVKNNLQVLASIVDLERKGAGDDQRLKRISARIRSVARVHNALYEAATDVDQVDLDKSLQTLVCEFNEGLAGNAKVQYTPTPVATTVDVTRAISASLVVNELLTNAVQHAFPDDKAGTVRVELARDGSQVHIIVSDDGVGMDTDRAGESAGVGTQLALQLLNELGAEWNMHSHNGVHHDIVFSLE
ncbi:MAG: sensor histidine kinase [Spirochaetota bacterium]